MFRLFTDSIRLFFILIWKTLFIGGDGNNSRSIKRMIVILLFLPIFGSLQLIHWLGFLLDEILFRGYRKIKIHKPLFVVGPPRSGTTLLHRALAEDDQFTTFSTWEGLFALSVTERKFWLTVIRIDRLIGRPFARLMSLLEKYLSTQLDSIHRVTLNTSEEDYFSFTPILACFILVIPFPFEESIWRMGTFDRDVDVKRKKRLMSWYKSCLQKHLYVNGTDKRLLSKNAAFASLLGSLDETFPDARYLCCMRDPLETLPSQLSAIRPGLKLFAVEALAEHFRERFVELFRYYYDNLTDVISAMPENRAQFVDMVLLQNNLYVTVTEAYARFGLSLCEQQRRVLLTLDGDSKAYHSSHSYSLDEFGLDREELETIFASVYERYEFFKKSALKKIPDKTKA